MIKVRNFIILCFYALVGFASPSYAIPARNLEYFLWPAARLLSDQNENNLPNYCEMVLHAQPKVPLSQDLQTIDRVVQSADQLLVRFKSHWQIEKSLPDDLALEFKQIVPKLIDLENQFGFELGLEKRYVHLKESISVLLALDGFVPSFADLSRLDDICQKQLALAQRFAGKIEARYYDRIVEGFRWNLSMLQKMESNYEVIHGANPGYSNRLVIRYLALKKH